MDRAEQLPKLAAPKPQEALIEPVDFTDTSMNINRAAAEVTVLFGAPELILLCQIETKRACKSKLEMSHHHFTRTFNIDDTAVVLIDHQVGTCGWVHSIDASLLEKNVRILATFATEMGMPLVLTSSM